jgi:hypothetical protein
VLIRNEQVGNWEDLQDKVQAFFEEMGYVAQSPYDIPLAGRGQKEVDVFVEDRRASVATTYVIECKWWNTDVPQDVVHSFHTVVHGCGANTGFIISKIGFQPGAREAAQFTNIRLLTFEELQHAFGDQWFLHEQDEIRKLMQKFDQVHHLHFDQWNNLPIHNNKIFHTQDLSDGLSMLAMSGINLALQARSRRPESYLGPEPVEMTCDPLNPLATVPSGQTWHIAPTVRDYFRRLRQGLTNWITAWNALEQEAQASFNALSEETQFVYFDRAFSEQIEETPLRVLKSKLPADEYKKLKTLLIDGIVDITKRQQPPDTGRQEN